MRCCALHCCSSRRILGAVLVQIEIKMILYRYRIARANDGRLFAYGYDRATADVRIIELQLRRGNAHGVGQRTTTAVELDGAPALDLNAGWWWAQYCAHEGSGSALM